MISNPKLQSVSASFLPGIGAKREDLKGIGNFADALQMEIIRVLDVLRERDIATTVEAMADIAELEVRVRTFVLHVRQTGMYERNATMLGSVDALVKLIDSAKRNASQLSIILMNENKHGV